MSRAGLRGVMKPRDTISPKKPLELELKLRNNALKSRRLQLGLSAPDLAKKVGMNYGAYIRLENLKQTPYLEDGSLRKSAALLCKFYRVLAEDLFPPDVRAVVNPVQRIEVTVHDMALLLEENGPEAKLLEAEKQQRLSKSLAKLHPVESKILQRRFGLDDDAPQGRRAIGTDIGLSGERVRQIELIALSKLKKLLSAEYTDEIVSLCHHIYRHTVRNGFAPYVKELFVTDDQISVLVEKELVELRPVFEGSPLSTHLTEKGYRIAKGDAE